MEALRLEGPSVAISRHLWKMLKPPPYSYSIEGIQMVRFITAALMMVNGSFAADFEGRIVGVSSQPVPDVDVFELNRKNAARTDVSGFFKLPNPIGPVVMHHKDYAPRFLLPAEFTGMPTIRMIARPLVEWKIRPCGANLQPRGVRKVKLDIPRQYSRTTSRDVDYELTIIKRSPVAVLRILRNVITSNLPSHGWFEDLVSVDVRPIDLAGSKGYDFRGMTASGLRSRSMSAGDTIVAYSGVEQDASAAFDKVLESACYE